MKFPKQLVNNKTGAFYFLLCGVIKTNSIRYSKMMMFSFYITMMMMMMILTSDHRMGGMVVEAWTTTSLASSYTSSSSSSATSASWSATTSSSATSSTTSLRLRPTLTSSSSWARRSLVTITTSAHTSRSPLSSSSEPSSSSSNSNTPPPTSGGILITRRHGMMTMVNTMTAAVAAGFTVLVSPEIVYAGGGGSGAGENDPRITTRMGGLLEPYSDPGRGIRIMAPSGWNKFDGEAGAYDLKWQDLVDPTENIKISSTPVKSTTESVAVLGNVQQVGESLAQKRSAKLISATERLTENILFYTFEFQIADGTHQLLLLCVAKSRLWSLDANSKESRWNKRDEMYRNVLGSFVPKLNPPS